MMAWTMCQHRSAVKCVFGTTVPYLIMVVKISNYCRETVITTVITSQYTVQTVVTNHKLRCRPLLDNDHI